MKDRKPAVPHQALTLVAKERLRVLQTPCEICPAYKPEQPPTPLPVHCQFQGIWDTGATHSAITQAVVDRCGLKSVGMAKVDSAHGSEVRPQYLINIRLHQAQIHSLLVTLASLKGADALIGMDVITLGDFAVTNQNGRTTFTFRIPSIATIDYAAEAKHTNDQRTVSRPPGGGSVNPATRGFRRR